MKNNDLGILRDKTLLGLLCAVVLMMIGVGMIVALLPQRIIELDGNGQSVGYIASAFACSYLLLQLPIGSLADKVGFKLFLIIGYLLCFFAGLVFYFASNSNMIFFARFLQGAGEAPVWALAPALLSLRFSQSKGKVMGAYNASMHFGLTLGPVLGIVLAKLLTRNEIFLVYACACLTGAIIIYSLVAIPSKKKLTPTNLFDSRSILQLINKRQTLVSLLGITLYGAGYGTFLTAIPVFLLQEKAFIPLHVGVFFMLFYVAISLSQVITGPLSDRFGRNVFMILGLLLAAAGIMLTPAANFPFILLALLVASLGMGIFYLASMAFLNERVPDALKGTISGAYYLFWGVGYFFGPLIITQTASLFHFQAALTGYAFLLLLIAAVMMKILGWKNTTR